MMRTMMIHTSSSLQEYSDETLLDLAGAGNQKAWQDLVRRYYSKIMATVHRIYGHKADNEDIVQEIFIEIAKSIKNFRHDSSFSTFVYRIAVNTTYRYIKRNKPLGFVSESLDFLSQLFSHENEAVETPHESTLKSESADIVNAALKQISADKRLALILFEVEELTLKEIAEVLKIPLQTVWSRVYNGRKELCTIITKMHKRQV